MRLFIFFLFVFFNSFWYFSFAQEKKSIIYAYLYNDVGYRKTPYIYPVVNIEGKKFTKEFRYNYDYAHTFSAYIGKKYSVGKKFYIDANPAIGVGVGDFTGVLPSVQFNSETSFYYFYSSNQYGIDVAGKNNSFFFNWSELSAKIGKEGLRGGITAQFYKTPYSSWDIRKGVVLAFLKGDFSFMSYFFDLGTDDFVLTMGFGYSFGNGK